MKHIIILIVIALIAIVNADVYLLGLRGSNNRLNGQNRNRQNANRLFDSQNNDRGGHNVGSLYYYDKSITLLEWTAQHSCGNANNACEFVLQYMCNDLVRDGNTETTIPNNANNCLDGDCDTDARYGRQESWEYYKYCTRRSRNRGLYTAERLPKNNNNRRAAIHTRQNNNGNRYGYECPEERDYYPYWGPTPWKDIAILTNDPQRCTEYAQQSQNVLGRWYCKVEDIFKLNSGIIPITQEECEAFEDKSASVPGTMAKWTYVPPHNLPPPKCLQNRYTRDNHHGNTVGGQMYSYNWTMPSIPHERCVLRLRYNITTSDFPGFANASSLSPGVDYTFNNDEQQLVLNDTFKMTRDEAKERGYWVTNNPNVDIFGNLTAKPIELQLNINTAQFFRTFEDRSHRFAIRSREGKYPADATIYNVNVRGKRGNIVQTYPSVEYDYQPNRLEVSLGDYIHFQWTGSNTNPNNNDGQGLAGTDRNNIVAIADKPYLDAVEATPLPVVGGKGSNHIRKLTSDGVNFLGWDDATLIRLATLSSNQFGGDMEELDDAGTYFNLEPKMVVAAGVFNYMCTRNNNFSNRSQKGTIIVDNKFSQAGVIGWEGGALRTASASVVVQQGVLPSVQELAISTAPRSHLKRYDSLSEKGYASDIVMVSGAVVDEKLAAPVEIVIHHNASPISDAYIAWAPSLEAVGATGDGWKKLDTKMSESTATTTTDLTGVFIVKEDVNVIAIIGIVIGAIILITASVAAVLYCRKKSIEDHTRLHETINV